MNRTPATSTRRICVAAVGLAAALVAGPVAGPVAAGSRPATVAGAQPGRPMVAYSTEDDVVVADRRGTVLSRIPRGYGGYSLGGNLLAKAYNRGTTTATVGFDARSGERRFRIDDTLLIPTVLRAGRAVAFSGQGERDRYATSLWIRNEAGRERKLIQFSFGGSPGVPTGISEGLVLEHSSSRDAGVLAVVAGDDIVGFEYDIWVVDVATRGLVRLTKDHRSRFPAMSPDGARVAYFREDSMCGGPMPGYRGGDLVVVGSDGERRQVLHDGTCERWFDRARWLTDHLLVATQHTRREGSDPTPPYDSRLVVIDVDRRMVSRPISMTDRVGQVSVSPGMRRIAYTDWTARTGFWVFSWKPTGSDPGQDEWAQGTTRRFPTGRVPHLRGDSADIASY